MKVLMLLSKPFKPEPWIYREAKTLVDAGHQVKIIGWNREKNYKNKEILDKINIERIPIQAPYGSFIGLLPLYPVFYFILILKSLSFDFDVIECHNFDTLPIGIIISKIKRKKVIYHSLDLYFTWFARETSSKIKRYLSELFRKFEGIFLKYIDHLIVTAPGYIEYYKKYKLKCQNTILFNTPSKKFIDLRNVHKSTNKNEDFVVSYIGEVRYEKPLLNLIKATEKLKDVKVLIVGGGVKADKIKEKSKSYNHVSIVEQVPYKEVINYYLQSDCTYAVYDSKVENIIIAIPVKVFESMAMGIPVIVNKNIWTSDFVEKNRIGLCADENNIKEIENCIQQIKMNKKLISEFSSNGKKLFNEIYNWEKQEKKLIKIYNNLIEN